MALVPCKVCGSLNSEQAEVCLSCGYSPNAQKRPAVFQWAAFAVVAILTIPLVLNLLNRVEPRKQQLTPPDATAWLRPVVERL